jgi:hypothetical protein
MYNLPAPMVSRCLVLLVTRSFSFRSSGFVLSSCRMLEVLDFCSNFFWGFQFQKLYGEWTQFYLTLDRYDGLADLE